MGRVSPASTGIDREPSLMDGSPTPAGSDIGESVVANSVVAYNQGTHSSEPAHVLPTTPSSGSWLQFSQASRAATCYQPRKGSLQRPYELLESCSTTSHHQEEPSRSSTPPACSPALSFDHPLAFQPATRASRRTDVEMTRVQSQQRAPPARIKARPSLLHQTSRVRLLGASSARLDIESSDTQFLDGHKRLLRHQHNRVKLVWIYSFILTLFILTTGLYPLGVQFYRTDGLGLTIGGRRLGTVRFWGDSILGTSNALDAPLRCNIGMSDKSGEQANSGVNSLSGVVDIQASTGTSLSNDIWGWKRHKGIVYANSHNDEMHGDRAFTHALSLGLASIEADVWLAAASSHPDLASESDSVLLVGHDDHDLRTVRTLKKIYLDPIWEILERVNQGNDGSQGWNGVFTDIGVPDQTLLLLIDTKNEVDSTYAELRRLLTPFREKGYLSHFTRTSPNSSITDGKLTLGPLTVIGTGDTPINSILRENPRYIFKDAPLTNLNQPIIYPDPKTGSLTQVDWHPSFAPMASAKLSIASHASYFTSSVIFLPIRQAFRLAFSTPAFLAHADSSKFVREAHARGIESRWWGVARHPKALRWALWGYVKDMGTDWLNADDLDEVAEFYRKRTEDDRLCI